MKTSEEIEKIAEKEMMGMEGRFGFVAGYEKCQEDIGKELEALRVAIRKNTWYDIDGEAQVNLSGIDNNLLNKQG